MNSTIKGINLFQNGDLIFKISRGPCVFMGRHNNPLPATKVKHFCRSNLATAMQCSEMNYLLTAFLYETEKESFSDFTENNIILLGPSSYWKK